VKKIRPHTTYRCCTIVYYYTLQHVLTVLISHHLADIGYAKRNAKGESRLFTVLFTVTLFQKWNNKVKTNT